MTVKSPAVKDELLLVIRFSVIALVHKNMYNIYRFIQLINKFFIFSEFLGKQTRSSQNAAHVDSKIAQVINK